jgi:antitoxin (DNA-binding transcriptional repressor) of toxin-antitoxin stability system
MHGKCDGIRFWSAILMPTVTLEQAQQRLSALIEALHPGEELLIVRDDALVARLIGAADSGTTPRRPGTARGRLTLGDGGDEHLLDFADYMP